MGARQVVAKYLIKVLGGPDKAYAMAGFNQYGLLYHDLLAQTSDVEEALRRLPKHIKDERNFRLIRASYLDMQKRVLPKEQWTTREKDVLYLQPYLDEVEREREERERWESE